MCLLSEEKAKERKLESCDYPHRNKIPADKQPCKHRSCGVERSKTQTFEFRKSCPHPERRHRHREEERIDDIDILNRRGYQRRHRFSRMSGAVLGKQ